MHSHASSRADVVSCLLDPAYYPSHSFASYQPDVYTDRKGILHTYRHFPPYPSSPVSPATPDDDDSADAVYVDPFSHHAPRRSSSLTRPTSPYYPSSSSSPSSSPPSYDDDESPLDDAMSEKPQCNPVKKALRRCREKRRASLDSYVAEEEEPVVDAPAHPELDDDEQDKDAHGVPTCTEALKRQWQSLSLSLHFRVFRARRRLKRVLSK